MLEDRGPRIRLLNNLPASPYKSGDSIVRYIPNGRAEGCGEQMKVRIRDIARKAGVSPATVSNALNGRGGVGDETQQKILDLAREMGYVREKPQDARRCVRLVVYKRHGQVVMDTQFFAELIEGVERECHKCGLELIISHIHMEKDTDHVERIDALLREPHQGILLLATELRREDMPRFERAGVPLLVMDSLFHHLQLNTVVMNNVEAGYLATSRLIRSGHREVGLITASDAFDINNFSQRREGYGAAMREAGLEAGGVWFVTPTLDGAYRDMRALLKGSKGALPTAFFAANDIIAVGAMRAMLEAGVRIPEDVSVIGMDDLSVCEVISPPLTTVRVSRAELGVVAVRRIVEMMADGADSAVLKTQVGVSLVERKSVRKI